MDHLTDKSAREGYQPTQALERSVPPGHLEFSRPPAQVLKEAKIAADELKRVIDGTSAVVKMGESEHLKCEAWQTLGHFYGVAGKIVSTEFIQYGDVEGFNAVAVLVDLRTGIEVSRAEAMCLDDEEKWSTRPKYEKHYVCKDGSTQKENPGSAQISWVPNPKRPGKNMPEMKRVLVGDEQVPLFQLKSMAQTRAISKVHNNYLRWVVLLAGYDPLPAEELDDDIDRYGEEQPESENPHPQERPAAGSQAPAGRPQQKNMNGSTDQGKRAPRERPMPPPGSISKGQVSKLWAVGLNPVNNGRGALDAAAIGRLVRDLGFDDIECIPAAQFERALAAITAGKV
jgi:hypothetical protein